MYPVMDVFKSYDTMKNYQTKWQVTALIGLANYVTDMWKHFQVV